MFSLWLSGGIRNETDYWYFSRNHTSLGQYCETVVISVLGSELFTVRLEQTMTSQLEWWGKGWRGRTGLDDWWQRQMKLSVRWGQAFFPDSDPGQQKSDIHSECILLETFKTQSITADWCGKYITVKNKWHDKTHTEMFFIKGWWSDAAPDRQKYTHRPWMWPIWCLCNAFSPQCSNCTLIFPWHELWSADMIDTEVRVGAALRGTSRTTGLFLHHHCHRNLMQEI